MNNVLDNVIAFAGYCVAGVLVIFVLAIASYFIAHLTAYGFYRGRYQAERDNNKEREEK